MQSLAKIFFLSIFFLLAQSAWAGTEDLTLLNPVTKNQDSVVPPSPVVWQSTHGPYGGIVADIAQFHDNPNMLFAALEGGGVYKSINGGATWFPVNRGLPFPPASTFTGLHTTCLATTTYETHPVRREIFVGTAYGQGIFKSTDEGEHWIPANQGISLKPYSAVTSLTAYSEMIGSTTLLANVVDAEKRTFAIYKSSDGGDTWVEYDQGLFAQSYYPLSRPFLFTDHVLYTSNHDAVYKRSSNDPQWNISSQQSFPSDVLALASKNHALLAGFAAQGSPYPVLFKSLDDGVTWIPSDAGLAHQSISSLVFKDEMIIAGAATFHTRNIPYSGGLFASSDGGDHWLTISTDIPNEDVICLKKINHRIFAGLQGNGVYQSQDGLHFQESNTGINSLMVASLAADKQGNIFAGTNGGLFKTADQGFHWISASHGMKNTSFIANIAVANDDTLYAGGAYNGVFKSTDHGQSWQAMNSGLGDPRDLNITSIVTDGATVYVGMFFHGGLFKSTDQGAHWQLLDLGLPPAQLTINAIAKYKQALYVSVGFKVYQSLDEGKTWHIINDNVPLGTTHSILGVDNGTVTGVIYLGGDQGVYRSTDGGQHWLAMNNGIQNLSVQKIIYGHSRLYVCSYGGDVYMSSDEGKNWTRIREGFSSQTNSLSLLATGDELYLGTINAGIYKTTLP